MTEPPNTAPLNRTLRLHLVDARDRAAAAIDEYTEYVRQDEEPPEEVQNRLASSVVIFHEALFPHIRADIEGECERSDVVERTLSSDCSAANDPELDMLDFLALRKDLEDEFYDLGFGKLVKP